MTKLRHFRTKKEGIHFPSSIQLYPNLTCNQKCSFCFNHSLPPYASEGIDAKKALLLIDILHKTGVSEINLLGGEPTLMPWIDAFIKESADCGIALNLSTNGSAPDVIRRLAGIPTNLLNIGFSLEGAKETHNKLTCSDNFSKLLSGLQYLISEGKEPVVKTVLTRENSSEIDDLLHYLIELGTKRYYILHEDIMGTDVASGISFPAFYDFYLSLKTMAKESMDVGFVAASGFYKGGDLRCDAGINKVAIMPDGAVLPCSLFAGFREFCLGNIFKDTIEQIEEQIEIFSMKCNGKNRCRNLACGHYSTCNGGCPAHSYYFYGSFEMIDPRCAFKTSAKCMIYS
ncbi:MAG: radical SAM protein [Nitrospirae bacterium]|nr:radical SAM protein [Nitrospirota bacterium]